MSGLSRMATMVNLCGEGYKQRIDYCLSSSLSVCIKKLITVAKIITDIIITSFISNSLYQIGILHT